MAALDGLSNVGHWLQQALPRDAVQGRLRDYRSLYRADAELRRRSAKAQTNAYYDLVTDFYEFGWGRCFHFAPIAPGEKVAQAILRHEHFMALRLGLAPGQKVLDAGCGVGGPLLNMARLTGADITGLNINAYQIARAERYAAQAGLSHRCTFVECDFTDQPFDDESFDAAYVIEAACHAGDRRDLFREVRRVLRPGGLFAGYEWCLTDRFDPENEVHQVARRGIEEGNSLPALVTTREVDEALTESGLTVLETCDLADASEAGTVPWYTPLAAGASLRGFLSSRAGLTLTHLLVSSLERAHLSPRGTTEVHDLLTLASRSLVSGGEARIFTPMYFFLARREP